MLRKNKKAKSFLACQGVSLFGSSIVQFSIIWYVTLETSSGVWVTLLTLASYLPQFIISFFSGVWADMFSKKKLIIISDSVIAFSTLILVILIPFIKYDVVLLILLIIISIIRSLGSGIQTSAVNSVIPEIVDDNDLMKFNGFNAFIQSLVQFVAPIVAGILLSYTTFQIALLVDIITATIGIIILLSIPLTYTKKISEYTMYNEIKKGIIYAYKNKFIGLTLVTFGIFIFLCVPVGFLSALFVNRYYGDTYFDLSLVEVVGFIGMTIGGLAIGVWGGFKKRTFTLFLGILMFGILGVLMGALSSFILYLVLMLIYGIVLTAVQTAYTTLLQENTEQSMQGRIFGLFGAMYSLFLPLGMITFGPLADIMSLRLLMIISGALLIIMAIYLLINKKYFNHITLKKEEDKQLKEINNQID